MNSLFLGLASFATCLMAMPVAIFVAKKFGFVDRPGKRKKHTEPTPILGGVAIFVSVVLVSTVSSVQGISGILVFWFSLVLLLGVLDDYFDVSYRIRLFCQACIVVGIFFTTGLVVAEVGSIAGGEAVRFVGYASVFFTIVGVLGAINSVNMMDGVDGLLGALSLVSIATILLYSLSVPPEAHSITPVGISVVIGSLLAFLFFNSRFFGLNKALVFMGDSGSTTIGFLITYLLIDYTQGDGAVFSPVMAGWIIGVPLLDASGVIVCRLLRRKSPFSPDRSHFHHMLLDAGYSVNRTVFLLAALQFFMIVFAAVTIKATPALAEAILFWGFVGLVVVRAAVTMVLVYPMQDRRMIAEKIEKQRIFDVKQREFENGLVSDLGGVGVDIPRREKAAPEDRKLAVSE